MVKVEHIINVLSELQIEYIYDIDMGPPLKIYTDEYTYLEFGYDTSYGFIYTGMHFVDMVDRSKEVGED